MAMSFQRIKKGATLTFIGVLLVAITSVFVYANFTYSKGSRNGTVIKMSEKGIFFKTNEGQLNVGAYVPQDNGGVPTTIWEFSVPKGEQEVLDDLDKAVNEGRRAKLYYKEKNITLPWRGETKYLVYKVEIL